jgi:hypothetical protein
LPVSGAPSAKFRKNSEIEKVFVRKLKAATNDPHGTNILLIFIRAVRVIRGCFFMQSFEKVLFGGKAGLP